MWAKTLMSGLLTAFLWITTFLLVIFFTACLFADPRFTVENQSPLGWVGYLNPLDSYQTHNLYLLAFAASLVWKTVGAITGSRKPGWLQMLVPGTFSLILWAGFEGFAHYRLAMGFIQYTPAYLDETLVSCALFWILQKMIVMALQYDRALIPQPPVERPEAAVQNPQKERVRMAPPVPQAAPPSAQAVKPAGRPMGRPSKIPSLDLERRILDFILQEEKAKISALVEVLGAPRRTINRCLEKLLKEGRLERSGKGRGAEWRTKATPQE